MKLDRKSLLLYAVTDRHWLHGRTLYEAVEEALQGGVTFVQVREKDDMQLSHDDFKKEAEQIRDLCHRYYVPFVLDDDVELAAEIGADGVHVGQTDMEAADVRKILGPDKILGVSAETLEEAKLAEAHGADYLGVGAIFPTGSKHDAQVTPIETLKEIVKGVTIPVIAIGGITRDNVTELAGTGIDGIAVISAIFSKDNIREATEDLKRQVIRTLGIT